MLPNHHPSKRTTPPDPDDDWSIYFYNPSLPAAIAFSVLYLIPFIYHAAISLRAYTSNNARYYRHSYTLPLLLAAVIEVNGYAQRAASTQSVQDIGLFATSQTMIVLAPVLVCASLYVLLARVIRAASASASAADHQGQAQSHTPSQNQNEKKKEEAYVLGFMKVTWLPRIFITLDVGAMLTQGGGSGVAAAGEWEGQLGDTGTGILIAGLALQVITFTAFLFVVIRFHVQRGTKGLESGSGSGSTGMRKVIWGVYIAGFFIMVRSIFRLVEFACGTENYIMSREWPVYVLEAVPMWIAFMVLGWFHPSRFLGGAASGVSNVKGGWFGRRRGRKGNGDRDVNADEQEEREGKVKAEGEGAKLGVTAV